MTLYLDTSVLIVYLFGEVNEPERFRSSRVLFDRIESGEVKAVISFYALQELYSYILRKSPPEDVDEAFRISLLTLFGLPLIVVPYLDRTKLELWRRKLSVSDATDLPHVAVALERNCDTIVAYDESFRGITDALVYHTPEELVEMGP